MTGVLVVLGLWLLAGVVVALLFGALTTPDSPPDPPTEKREDDK